MKIFVDPWESEYTGFFQVEEEFKEERVDIDIEVPKEKWAPIFEKDIPPQKEVIFLDGVRRMHQRVVIERNGKIFYGGLGTFAAGAMKIIKKKRNDLFASLIETSIKRVLIVFKEVKGEIKDFKLPGIPFEVSIVSMEKNDPQAPLEKLQELMRAEEVRLADTISSYYKDIPLVVDGTLYFPWKNAKVLGFVKSLHNLYIPDELIPVVLKLREGERTPVFLITFKNRGELSKKYSWFIRLKELDEREFPYAGIIRMEAPGTLNEEEFSFLRSWSLTLKDFISDRLRDKRSPQNLLPVGVLERELKKRIGSEYLITQRIRTYIGKRNI